MISGIDRGSRIRVRLWILLVVSSALLSGCAQTPDIPVLNGSVTTSQWTGLADSPALRNCASSDCVVLTSLIASFQALSDRDFPNTMAKSIPSAPAATSDDLPIVASTRTSPGAASVACKSLAIIAMHVSDLSTALHALEIATRLTSIDHDCTRQVVGASPKTLEGTQVVQEARSLCTARKQPFCEKLVR